MTRKYFGTDGIRGKAGDFPLTEEFIQKLAYSAADVLSENVDCKAKKVVIGVDTRESCFWIFEALCQGFNKAGFAVDYAGVVSTPCLSLLTKQPKYSFGVMISASHNPYHDNGIKFFSHSGEKLIDEIEHKIERKIAENQDTKIDFKNICDYKNISLETYDFYKDFLINTLGKNFDLTGYKIALDCANGSLFDEAPKFFRELGADVMVYASNPDGKNINDCCGSTHIDNLVKLVQKNTVDISFAFDGDGDRVIAVRSDGKVLNGDFLMGILAKNFKEKNELRNNYLVLTVMSNLGLKLFLKHENITVCETKVGDRYVYEGLKKNDAVIGGEQSGHIILKNYGNTGDGLLIALHIVKILKELGKQRFFKITEQIKILPQVLVNVRLKEKKDIFSVAELKEEYEKIERDLDDKGRILVRYSGTEPLLRIMIEGENHDEIKRLADGFAGKVLGMFA